MEAMPVNTMDRLSQDLRDELLQLHSRTGGHLGSALSVVEILTVVLGHHFRWSPDGFAGDRFVLSKGHAAMAYYCWLRQRGWVSAGELATFGQDGSRFEPHPNERRVPWVHASTGSLGQGLSIGIGLALGERLRGGTGRVFVLIGDGEANEGQVWEAARAACQLRLANLTTVLDDNRMQQDGPTPDIMPVPDLVDAWRAMGWVAITADGHDCSALDAAVGELLAAPAHRPRLLHAHTIKGRGVDFLEGQTESHYPPPLSANDLQLIRYARQRRGPHVAV